MELKIYNQGDVVVLEPAGKIMPGPDVGELDEKLYALLGQKQKKVIIDLSKTMWLGSSGLTILLHHNCKFKEAGCVIKLANLTKKIQQLMAITRLVLVFEIHETLESALNSFKN